MVDGPTGATTTGNAAGAGGTGAGGADTPHIVWLGRRKEEGRREGQA